MKKQGLVALLGTAQAFSACAETLYSEPFANNSIGPLTGQFTARHDSRWESTTPNSWIVQSTGPFLDMNNVTAFYVQGSHSIYPGDVPGLFTMTQGSVYNGKVYVNITGDSMFGMAAYSGSTRIAGIRRSLYEADIWIGGNWYRFGAPVATSFSEVKIRITYGFPPAGVAQCMIGNTQIGPDVPVASAVNRFAMESSFFSSTGRAYFDRYEVTHTPGIITFPVSGTVVLGDYFGELDPEQIDFELRDSSGTVIEAIPDVGLNPYGQYTFHVTHQGVYTIVAKGRTWLAQANANVSITGGGASNVYFTLTNGDVDGNNEVGPGDFGELSAAFGSASGDSNWNPNADLDGDTEVGPSDFGILSTNFGMAGD